MGLRINSERLKRSIEDMGRIGKKAGARGITRLALTEEDRQARDLLVRWFEKDGLEIRLDPIGNIFGIRPGTDADALPVVTGSHLDTVREAGIFDGAVGVLGALEVIRKLNDEDIQTRRPVAVACFTNEEGARFQPDMMGGMVFSGKYPLGEALARQDDDGASVGEALDLIGYRGLDSLKAGAYLELHVEQGPVLDRRKVDIGVVEGIQGIAWWHGRFDGEANHAGTTPLDLRKDALLGGAELCCKLRHMALELGHGTVSTMGRLHPEPDVINVVPGGARFSIDFRQYDEPLYEKGKKLLGELVSHVAESHGLSYKLEKVADAMPVHFEPSIVNLVESKAKEMGFSSLRMSSGAGHDAQFLNYACPTGMIFIPSINGRSHCPEEKTSFKDVTKGANVLLHCALELAREVS